MSKIGKIVKKDNSLFYWSCMYLFPKAQREAVYTVYAFCKHINNIVDGDMPVPEKKALITAWQEELHNIYDNKVPATDVGRHIYKNCMRFKLPREKFLNMLQGLAIDVQNPIEKMSYDQFDKYCQDVAGTPCYFAMKIMGIEDSTAEKLAENLGYFLQITDILLEVKDDAKMNRLYVPAELINKAKIDFSDPEHIVTNKNFTLVRKELGKIAEDSLKKAKKTLAIMNKKDALPFHILLSIYEKYFYTMKTRGWEIISPKPVLSTSQEWSLVLKSVIC